MKKFYVLNSNINTKEVEFVNIFAYSHFQKQLDQKVVNGYISTEDLRMALFYCFGSRCQYEIMVSDLFGAAKATKVDIYQQCLANIDLIAEIIRAEES